MVHEYTSLNNCDTEWQLLLRTHLSVQPGPLILQCKVLKYFLSPESFPSGDRF